jgi:hypothetical protein
MDKISQKFKKFFKIESFFFFLIFIFSFPNLAFAQWQFLTALGSFILSTTLTILSVSIVVILLLQLLLGAMGIINTILSNLLAWVISPGAVGWQYTQNPFVNAGLEITGGFVSIGLVLVLVAIAFATILRLEGWDTRRLLIRLIIVAALVYFAPVICGLIIDATNVFMYYFSDRIGGIGALTTTFLNIVTNIIRSFVGIPIIQQLDMVAVSILQLIFQIYLAFCLFSFFLLFVFRFSAIWIFVILSPIAFICWILPATYRYWEFWWRNFIQWCLAGPICAFFLYLGARAAQLIALNTGAFISLQSFVTGPLFQIIPYLFPLGLLNLGIVLGVQGAGIGSEMVLNLARRGFSWVQKTRPIQWAMGAIGEAPNYMQRAAGWLKRFEERPIIGGVSRILAQSFERGGRVIAPYFLPYAVRAREVKLPEGFEKMTPEEQAQIAQSPVYRAQERVQILGKMGETGTLAKTSQEFQRWAAAEMEQAVKSPTLRAHYEKDFEKFYNTLFNFMTEEVKFLLTSPEKRDKIHELIEQREKELREEYERNEELRKRLDEEFKKGRNLTDIAAGIVHFEQLRPQDVTKVPTQALSSIEAIWGAHRISPEKFLNILRTFDVDVAQKLLTEAGGWNQQFQLVRGRPEEEIELLIRQRRENPVFFNWLFQSVAGRQLPFAGREIMSREFKNYRIFQQYLPEYEKFAERIQNTVNLKFLEKQIINVQNAYNQAISQQEKERAKILNALAGEIEKRGREMVDALQNPDEVEEFITRFGQLELQTGFKKGPARRSLLSIGADLLGRLRQLRP